MDSVCSSTLSPHPLTLRCSTPRKLGQILRVKLHNFVTYYDVEFQPGPMLNVVLGPNGTGKSTIVCALVLGLGGQPKDLGRAKEISEYVNHTKDSGFVEIELAGRKYDALLAVSIVRCHHVIVVLSL